METFLLSRVLTPRSDLRDQGIDIPKNHAAQKNREGRLFYVSTFLQKIPERVARFAFGVLFTFNLAFADPRIIAPLLKKITQNVIPWIEHVKGLPNAYVKLKGVLRSTFTIINSIQIAADIDYLMNGKFQNHSLLTIVERAAFSIAHFGVGLAWLGELGFINLVNMGIKIRDLLVFSHLPKLLKAFPLLRDFVYLERLAQTVGKIRVFSLVPTISFLSIVEGAWAFGYACCSLDALSKLVDQEGGGDKSLKIKFAKNVAEFTLACLLLQGIVNVAPLGILGSLCIGLEISELIYK